MPKLQFIFTCAKQISSWIKLKKDDRAWCYYNNNKYNAEKYGVLYTWAAAMNGAASSNSNPSGIQGVCPHGWHLPSDEEWEQLAEYISNDNGGYTKNGDDWYKIGKYLKATSGWHSEDKSTDDYGFSGLPGGGRGFSGSFFVIGYIGFWWSATEDVASHAWYRCLSCYNESLFRGNLYKENGFSVRCLRD